MTTQASNFSLTFEHTIVNSKDLYLDGVSYMEMFCPGVFAAALRFSKMYCDENGSLVIFQRFFGMLVF